MITPPSNPKAQQARQAMIAYRDGKETSPVLTAEQLEKLRAMYPTFAATLTVDPGGQWCNDDGTSQHIDDPHYITVTLFDKRTEQETQP